MIPQSLKNTFKSEDLFNQALTHKSWINENPGIRSSNERLEFLGDAVLELVVSSCLFEKFPDKEEGFLTALRANLVNTQNLSDLAKSLKIGEALMLSKGEEESGGRKNPSLLADTVEAIIGAIYIDGGMQNARKFIEEHILSMVGEKLKEPLKDPKSRLQEAVQAKGFTAPKYRVIKESGPDHARHFTIHAMVSGKVLGIGGGKSKSEAQQDAAREALEKMAKER